MRRSRIVLVAVVAGLGLAVGCDAMHAHRRDRAAEILADQYEPEAPEGARGQARSSQLPGALSSEAGDIEGHLLHRRADPDFH